MNICSTPHTTVMPLIFLLYLVDPSWKILFEMITAVKIINYKNQTNLGDTATDFLVEFYDGSINEEEEVDVGL